jgi:hypothetical protein
VPAERIARIKPDYLARERRALGESWYRQEFGCSFEALEGLVYPDFGRRLVPGPARVGRRRRMCVYNYRLFDRYNRTVVSLAILGDDRATWRPDRFASDLWGCSVAFQFPIVKLLDYAAQVPALAANPNPFAAVVLAHLKAQETRTDEDARRVWKVWLVKGLYERGLGAEDVRRLFRVIDWMMDLPAPLERLFWQEIHQFQEEKLMPYLTPLERLWLEDNLKGLLEGIELGLELKFGAEGLTLLTEIRQIQDPKVPRSVLQGIRKATTAEELRRIWT